MPSATPWPRRSRAARTDSPTGNMELAKSFDPRAIEAHWYPFWESRGCFKASFERLLEIVGADEEDKARARGRFVFYRKRGYEINVNAIGEA